MANEVMQPGTGLDILSTSGPKHTLTKDEAFDLINRKSSATSQGRDPVHLALQKQWFVNVASFLGMSGLDTMTSFMDLDPNFVALDQEDSFKANLIFRFVMYTVAQMTSSEPNMSVMAKSPDPDDQFGAQVGEHFLAHFDDELNFRGLRRDLAFWMAVCGNAFLKVDWDARDGEPLDSYKNPFTEESAFSGGLSDVQKEIATKLGMRDRRFTGKLDVDVLAPFQVVVPNRPRRMKDMPWVVLEYERSLDWVWDRYPERAKDVTPDDLETSVDGQYWRRLTSLVQDKGYTLASPGGEEQEMVRVRELWVPPSGRFKNGHWVRCLNRTYLDHGPHPYHAAGVDLKREPWMRFPVTHFKHADVPGRFWGMSLVEHLIDPQRDYNRARHQSILQRDRLGHPQFMAPMGTKWDTLNNEIGSVLEYRTQIGFGKPEIIPPPPVSSMVVESMDRALSDMRIISAQGEAVQGDVPTGMRSGAALRALQEKDNMTISPTIQGLEEGWQEGCTKILTLTHAFMDLPTMVNVYGELQSGDVHVFKGSDLNGNVFVRIRKGSMMPKSKAEKMQSAMEMIQAGVLNPMDGDHFEIVMKALEVEGADKLLEGKNLDRRRARMENHMFLKPQVDEATGRQAPFPPVQQHDDHAEHLKVHTLFKKSDAYETLPPMRKMAFDAHELMHQQALMQQMEAMMMMRGGAQGPGGGSPPKEPGQASQPAERKPTPGSPEANQ